MLRFLEANGYDLSYTTDVDTARRGNLIKNHKVFMAVGHDEYWSNEQRTNVEAARDAGVNLAFLTGNDIFWKTRWEPSIDRRRRTGAPWSATRRRRAPSTRARRTGRAPGATRASPPKDGGKPENSLLGNIFTVNGRRNDSMQVPPPTGRCGCGATPPSPTMAAGRPTLPARHARLRVELGRGQRIPARGCAQLSRTTVNIPGQYVLQNYGDVYGRDQDSRADMYRAPAARWCSVPARSSGRGGSTTSTPSTRHTDLRHPDQAGDGQLPRDMGAAVHVADRAGRRRCRARTTTAAGRRITSTPAGRHGRYRRTPSAAPSPTPVV